MSPFHSVGRLGEVEVCQEEQEAAADDDELGLDGEVNVGMHITVDPGLGADEAFQEVHGVVFHKKTVLQRLNTKPLKWKGPGYATNQDVKELLPVHDETVGITDVDKSAEEHANVEKGVENYTSQPDCQVVLTTFNGVWWGLSILAEIFHSYFEKEVSHQRD